MHIDHIAKTQAINILIAVLIGIFVVFPDVLRLMEDTNPSNHPDWEQGAPPMPPPGEQNVAPPDQGFEPPSGPGMRPGPPPARGNSIQSVIVDLLFFVLLTWGLLLLNNPGRKKQKNNFYIHSSTGRNILIIALTFIFSYLGIFLNSLIHLDNLAQFNPFPWYMNGYLIFKGIFIFVSVVLSGQLLNQLYRQQEMSLEYERLKTESIQNRFEALTAQISPHFFFNSLNSLSGLIREKEDEKALKYINEISNIFRYILQGKWQELVLLEEEINFLKAYLYLLDIKYGDKLEFRIDIDELDEKNLMLPAMSLQPLVENIIKHNIISREAPMLIELFIEAHNILVLKNSYQPREENSLSSGIGLSNLDNRYRILAGKTTNSYIRNEKYVVELPLLEKK